MPKKLFATVATFLLLFQLGKAQEEETILPKIPLSVSYYGNTIVHEGFKVSADWIWLGIEKTKHKKKKTKVINKGLYTTPYLSYYRHGRSHTGLQLGFDLLWRRSNPKGWFREVGYGFGYLRKYNLGKTYEVASDGSVGEAKNLASYGYATQTLCFATGKRINFQNNSSLTPFIRMNIDGVGNYNATAILNTSLEVGCRFILPFNPERGRYKIIKKTKGKK